VSCNRHRWVEAYQSSRIYCQECGEDKLEWMIQELKAKVESLEAENERLRQLLSIKADTGSTIRVELPTKENGMTCWVTSYKPEDEERIARLLANSLNLLCQCLYEIKGVDKIDNE